MGGFVLALANGDEIALDSVTLPLHAVIDCATREDALDIWDLLTPENLQSVTVYEGDVKTAEYVNVHLNSVQFVPNSGAVTAHFYMSGDVNSESTDENEYVIAAKILLGEEV